jgi:hypothetical protein
VVKAAFVLLLFALSYTAAFSQASKTDSIARHNSVLVALQTYQNAISGNAKVFNGVDYVNPLAKKRVKGHPNFESEDWMEGFILYEGQLYENVALQYNLLLNKVLIENVQSHATIELSNNLIGRFGINGHTFVQLPSGIDAEPQDMFYDLLYDGGVKVYVKRFKTIKETPDQKVMVTEFLEKRKLYLFKEGRYIAINNKKAALNAFEDHKQEMKKTLSQNRLSFRAMPELSMIALGQRYDELVQ